MNGRLEAEDLDLFHALKPIFENVAMAKVSTSAEEARTIGYLRPSDLISMNRDRQVADAKQTALAMVRERIPRPGPSRDPRAWRGVSCRREARDLLAGSGRICQ